MTPQAPSPPPSSPAPAAAPTRWLAGLSLHRLGIAAGLGTLAPIVLNPIFLTPFTELWMRGLLIALVLTLTYTLAGNWPQTKVPRWHVQILAVVLLAPLCAALDALWDTDGRISVLLANRKLMLGFFWITFSSLGIGLVVTMLALIREREEQVSAQALRFALERETLERQALDARLRVMTAQIEPHFLLNTLANVQALVETGSARAAPVLTSLIAYLRAAMPRLRSERQTLGDELALVRAYLDVMRMRIPDRLAYDVDVPAALDDEPFPSMALLTLVENAVRHGIDPAEAGGRIDVGARRIEGEGADPALAGGLRVWVEDGGVGLDATAPSGQGLANVRERIVAYYGAAARLELSEPAPSVDGGGRGLRAELLLPRPQHADVAGARP